MSDVDTDRRAPGAVEEPQRAGRSRWPVRLPDLLLGALLTVLGWFTLTQGRVHGRTYDEYMQDDYGVAVLKFYLSGGTDRSFLEFPDHLHMAEHGSGFELIIAAVQYLTGEQWQTRTVVNGIAGFIGIVLIALAGRELAGPWGGFAAAAGLALYPRYTGAMHNNSKDVPLAVAMILVLWLMLRLMRRWSDRDPRREMFDFIGIGAALGLAGAIRVNALSWVVLLGLLVAGFWARHGGTLTGARRREEIARQAGAALLIGTTCYLVMSLLWPYLLAYPVDGLLHSVRIMSAYDWNHHILFAGEQVLSTELPWYYAPVWLAVGSPLPVVLLTIAAAIGATVMIARRRAIESGILLVGGYVAVPLLMIIIAHPTLYNSLRQFLYIVPGMVLLAAVVLVRWVRATMGSPRRALAWGVLALAVVGQAEAMHASARIYPYEYAYFSPLAGGFSSGRKNFESTYYGTCTRAAAVWLAEHYRDYTIEPTFRDEVSWNSPTEADLPAEFIGIGQGEPAFRLTNGEPGDGYTVIHLVMLAGEPLCRVSVNDDYM